MLPSKAPFCAVFPVRNRFLMLSLVGSLAGCLGNTGQPAGPYDGDFSHIGDAKPGDGSDGAGRDDDPGRVTLHRLNRVEYNNTVRDLLGTSLRPADQFPADDRGYGYDNIADVLSLSPLLLEMYYDAAQTLIDEALKSALASAVQTFEAENAQATTGEKFGDSAWNLYSEGSLAASVPINQMGEYRITVKAWGQQAGDELPQMSITVNGTSIDMTGVAGSQDAPVSTSVNTMLMAGTQQIGVAFLNDYVDDSGADRNLIVDSISVEGPLNAAGGGSAERARIIVCEPDASDPVPCLQKIAHAFGKRAFRRPLADLEVDKLTALVSKAMAEGDDLATALPVMLHAILVSPHFVFRVELDPTSGDAHELNDYELASRLSYFLWSSMPDDELLAQADAGTLHDEDTLRAQVRRMLKDEKAEALVSNFAGQWLFSRALHDHDPDPTRFPDFSDDLRTSAKSETESYFRAFLFGDETMNHLLSANFGYLDARLGSYYGLSNAQLNEQFTRVTLPKERVGLLTQTTYLFVTSYPTRTSPVKRGKWLLEQLLCTPPPPPPKTLKIPPLEETAQAKTVREKLEIHRKNPVCASCHKLMDPLGFGLERYDAIGRYRETEEGVMVDDTGELGDGTRYQGPKQLAQIIESDPRYPTCITKHLLTYALGRGLKPADQPDVNSLSAAFRQDGYHLRTLIEEIVLSAPFRMRGARKESAP